MFDQLSDQENGMLPDGMDDRRMLGLWYDPDRLVIEGVYCDEVTAYRARRRWIEALKAHFLLEEVLDFSLKVRSLRGGQHGKVQCKVQCIFLTACGRYAFWRLTHHQAPEVQAILETAHLVRPVYKVGFDSFVDDMEFSVEDIELELCREREHYGRRARIEPRDPPWVRALRTIHNVASRLVGLTRH